MASPFDRQQLWKRRPLEVVARFSIYKDMGIFHFVAILIELRLVFVCDV